MQGQLHTMRVVVGLAVWALVVADVFGIAASVPSVRQASAPIDAGAISTTIGATIGWQAHSYDDMREWQQLFNKGARYLKLDPHWMPPSFCKTQTGVRDPADPRGCMVLNHDNPTPARTGYNTTDQIVDVLTSATFQPYFTEQSRFYFSLCFKSAPSLCNASSTEFQGWVSLVDDLVASINTAIDKHGLNVQFILDGDGVPQKCLVDKWQPWIATYISLDDPSGAFTSNNVSLGYNRFAVLNEPTYLFPFAAASKYGKFPQENETWLLWEPSSQTEIESMCDVYIDTGITHTPGLRFAINIDPAMFQVYSAPKTGTAWSANLTSSGHQPALVVLPRLNGTFTAVTVAASVADASALQIVTANFSQVLGVLSDPSLARPLRGLQVAGPPQASVIAETSAVPLVLVTDGASAGIFPSSGQALGDPVTTFTVPLASAGDSLTSVRDQHATSGQSPATSRHAAPARLWHVVSVVRGGVQACNLSLQLLVVDATGNPTRIGAVACVETGIVATNVSAAFVRVHTDLASGIVVYSSADKRVFGAVVCLNLTSGAASVNGPACTSSTIPRPLVAGFAPQPLQLHVGDHPSVDVGLGADGEVYVLETHGNGFCPNSETHNKEPTPGVCGQVPSSTPFVLDYTMGPIAAFQRVLMSDELVSACDTDVLHGAFSLGSAPSTALFSALARRQASSAASPVFPSSIGFAVAHDGFPTDQEDYGACGAPVSFEGVKLDAWQAQYRFPGSANIC